MSTLISRKLNFFKDCFEADSQSKILWNVYSAKVVQQQRVITKQFNGNGEIELTPKYANSLTKILDRFSREKSLLLCHSFLSTHHSTSSFGRKRKRKICCPILYYPATLVGNYVVIDRTKAVINPALEQLFKLYGNQDTSILDQVLGQSQALLSIPKTTFEGGSESTIEKDQQTKPGASDLTALFDQTISNAFASYASPQQYEPKVTFVNHPQGTSLHAVFKQLGDGQTVINSDLLLCVVPRSEGARGVLHELDLLANKNDYSGPLKSILQEPFSALTRRMLNKYRSSDSPPMPMRLSEPQQQVLQSSQQQVLSVLIGPPGTGKSYTIASLALNEYLRGNSVLVVSQNQHAVDVVRQKLIADFGLDKRLTVLTSEKGISRDVVKQIRELLSLKTKFDADELNLVEKKLKHALRQQTKLERHFAEACAVHLNQELPELELSLYQRLVDFFHDSVGGIQQMKSVDDSPRLLNEWFSLTEDWTNDVHLLVAKYINLSYLKLSTECASNQRIRGSLTAFTKALSAQTERTQKDYYSKTNYAHVLQATPLWFASLGNLNRSLPLVNGLFDVVIFDEATQCNLASSLPALARAKRAVIVGDPKQLKHMSFVSFAEQQALFNKHQLQSSQLSDNFRGHSLVDYALAAVTDANQVSSLDEHFRSEPQIIAFSNEHFYDSRLKIMTQRPSVSNDAVRLVSCTGKYRYKTNKEEADTLIGYLRGLVDSQSHLPAQEAHSFGVLSFFSHQANHLEQQVFDEFSISELRKHNIRCGTPFSFQGEERDHMLISCAIDANTKSASYTYLNRDDVFNVAITRARDSQTLFLSCAPEDVNSSSKLRAYIRFYEKPVNKQPGSSAVQDSFQEQVCFWLNQYGVDTYKNFMVAGTSIDIIAVHQGKSLAIDLIGFEGELKGALTLPHYQLLSRAGLPSFLLPYEEWQNTREQVSGDLLESLGASLVESTANDNEPALVSSEASFQEIFGLSISSIYSRLEALDEPRARNQLELLIAKYDQFKRLLGQCFIVGEITHSRYLNAFESLLGIALQNLSQAATGLEVIAGQLSIQKYQAVAGKASALFVEREQLIYDQNAKVHTDLQNNESALLQMDKTILKLSALKPASDYADIDLTLAENILDEMTGKLDLYQ